jgi:uncharacterized protein (TIGR02145 family)
MKNFVRMVMLSAVVSVCLMGCGDDNGTNNNGGVGGGSDYVSLGGLKWMKKNLNEETADSWCYDNSLDSCAKYGRLYTWAAAKSACQSVGMRTPTFEEWIALVTAAGGAETAGKKLKSKSGWHSNDINGNGTDNFGFSALPGGRRYSDGEFFAASYTGHWWTATEYESAAYASDYAYNLTMSYNLDIVMVLTTTSDLKSNSYSVRCVKND